MIATDHRSKTMTPRVGWVLYDGGCGFCFRWVHFWEKKIAKRGFALKDLQSAWKDGSFKSPEDKLLNDIVVLTVDGNIEHGADAYLFVARRIWYGWPFYAIFSLPGFNWVLWRGYRWFNRNRYRISRHCRLPNQNNSGRLQN
jgi:predicted DCC family thiol-disulfide oxidoreductase YuxK